MFPKTKSVVVILFLVIVALLIPFIAMQFTTQVNWTIFDFVAAGILLTVTGLAIELLLRKVKTTRKRILFILIILLLILVLWAELAVGVFNSPIAGN